MNNIIIENITCSEDPRSVKYWDYKIICKYSGKILYAHRLVLSKLDYFKSLITVNKEECIIENYLIIKLIVKYLYNDDSLQNFLKELKTFDSLLNIYNILIELDINIYNYIPIEIIIKTLDRAHEIFSYDLPEDHLNSIITEITQYTKDNLLNYEKLSQYKIYDCCDKNEKKYFIYAKMMFLIKKEKQYFSLKEIIDLYEETSIEKRDLLILYLIEKELPLISDSEQKIMLNQCYKERNLVKCYDNYFNRHHKLTQYHNIPYKPDKIKISESFKTEIYKANLNVRNGSDQICNIEINFKMRLDKIFLEVSYELRVLLIPYYRIPRKYEYSDREILCFGIFNYKSDDLKEDKILINNELPKSINCEKYLGHVVKITTDNKTYKIEDYNDYIEPLQYIFRIDL